MQKIVNMTIKSWILHYKVKFPCKTLTQITSREKQAQEKLEENQVSSWLACQLHSVFAMRYPCPVQQPELNPFHTVFQQSDT